MGKNCQRKMRSSQCSREGGHQVSIIAMAFYGVDGLDAWYFLVFNSTISAMNEITIGSANIPAIDCESEQG